MHMVMFVVEEQNNLKFLHLQKTCGIRIPFTEVGQNENGTNLIRMLILQKELVEEKNSSDLHIPSINLSFILIPPMSTLFLNIHVYVYRFKLHSMPYVLCKLHFSKCLLHYFLCPLKTSLTAIVD